jgi:hypothetical protein
MQRKEGETAREHLTRLENMDTRSMALHELMIRSSCIYAAEREIRGENSSEQTRQMLMRPTKLTPRLPDKSRPVEQPLTKHVDPLTRAWELATSEQRRAFCHAHQLHALYPDRAFPSKSEIGTA